MALLAQASDFLIEIWKKEKVLHSIEQLWLARRQQINAMPDDMMSWTQACMAEGESFLQYIADLLKPVGPDIGVAPTAAAMRGIMKVRGCLYMSCTICHHGTKLPIV